MDFEQSTPDQGAEGPETESQETSETTKEDSSEPVLIDGKTITEAEAEIKKADQTRLNEVRAELGLPIPEQDLVEPIKQETGIESEQINKAVVSTLIEKGVITTDEAASLGQDQVDEFIVRTADDFQDIPDTIPRKNTEKARRILGLPFEPGTGEIDTAERAAEIAKMEKEMSSYLDRLKAQHPYVQGFVLCGSRMDQNKIPAENSDADAVMILQDGYSTDSNTKEGRALVTNLTKFTEENQTESGLEVSLDAFYSADEFVEKLQSDEDESRLTWGWSPSAVKYIGESFGNQDVNGLIQEQLNSEQVKKQKREVVAKAQRTIKETGILEKTSSE